MNLKRPGASEPMLAALRFAQTGLLAYWMGWVGATSSLRERDDSARESKFRGGSRRLYTCIIWLEGLL